MTDPQKKLAIGFGVLLFSFTLNAQSETNSVITKPRPVAVESEWRPHLAVMMGGAQPEGRGQTSAEVGVDIGYQIYIPFSVAGEFTHSRIDDGIESKDRNTIWAKGTYNFAGDNALINHSYAGLALGAVLKSDGTSAAIAPVIGFDIPVVESLEKGFLSLGAISRYAIVSDGDVDTLSVGGVVKYWY